MGCATVERQKGLFSPCASVWSGSLPYRWENREDMGSVYERVSFNMRELTYRVHFTIKSIPDPFPMDEKFVIRIEDDNGVYDFNGRSPFANVLSTWPKPHVTRKGC